ncbi:Dol-P-Man:Man(5)GlcNAc(2)-PP-Dol alpha-1,3-mannosyltransferase [Fragariocoptes setiger]|uniref:dolichyl-P-Man:Man5GlcNAc2-PP-dolichol alpha-1,3-mannosyltransferase n=1 Tax=Fragariocoptes setiger TaxID=1670756 RepID=A0ABQ7SAX5_9ACAR|nr:Dol-P-Man:Man(5)GlcNAc(2)-PP-Dol alpha-1,3-mannosyltransferase [Fragariocoptes setiger]
MANIHHKNKQSRNKQPRVRFSWKKILKFVIDFINSWDLVKLLILIDVAINVFIVAHVKYTEIDWSTYMVQVEHFFNGTLDYGQIEGPTGPLVYPAGHIWIFTILYGLTDRGKNILLAQITYACIYIINLIVIYKIYSHPKVTKVPPYVFIFMCLASYRIHSIYVLRLFNDPIAMLLAYTSFYLLLERQHTWSTVFLSLALSVKMNILLFTPGFALIMHEQIGLVNSIRNFLIFSAIQLTLALPFLLASPTNYLNRAFDFGRVFLHQWTVNWRFVPNQIFTSQPFAIALLVIHAALVIVYLWPRWRRFLWRLMLLKPQGSNIIDDPMTTLAVVNFFGIACSRSLHYQFYVWYYHMLPLLLWSTNLTGPQKLLVMGLIELSWNTYPSTMVSSLILQSCHLCILIGLFARQYKQQHLSSPGSSVTPQASPASMSPYFKNFNSTGKGTPFPPKLISNQPNMSSICSLDSERSSSCLDLEDCKLPSRPKRTRQRLDHLTPYEKLQRRKMKNRVAAQTARDKRRAIMDHLEEQNKALKKKNVELEIENTRLREQLDALQSSLMLDQPASIKPAELINDPQQKEQDVSNLAMSLSSKATPGWTKLISILYSTNQKALSCYPNVKTECYPHFSLREDTQLLDSTIDRHSGSSNEFTSVDSPCSEYGQNDMSTSFDYDSPNDSAIELDSDPLVIPYADGLSKHWRSNRTMRRHNNEYETDLSIFGPDRTIIKRALYLYIMVYSMTTTTKDNPISTIRTTSATPRPHLGSNELRSIMMDKQLKPIVVVAFAIVAILCGIQDWRPLGDSSTQRATQIFASANVLIKVCDSKELKTVISRACMLYKRTKNSDMKMMRSGDIRVTRSTNNDYMAASKLATECCSVGCSPQIFAYNC